MMMIDPPRGDGDPDALGVYPGEDNPDYVPAIDS
jgi:hypothetical protein